MEFVTIKAEPVDEYLDAGEDHEPLHELPLQVDLKIKEEGYDADNNLCSSESNTHENREDSSAEISVKSEENSRSESPPLITGFTLDEDEARTSR